METSMRKLVASCAAVLMATALLAACGGGSDKPASSATTPTSASNGDGGDASGTSGDDDFAQLFKESEKERFKITYTSDDDDTDTDFYAQDGEGQSVYGDADSQFFTSSDGSISCNTDSGGKATCTEVPNIGASVNPFLGLFNAGKSYIDALGGSYGDTSSETIADRDAKCVTFSAESIAGNLGGAIAGALGEGSATYCVDEQTGVLLLIKSTDKDGKEDISFRVIKFEEPSDSDFEPPATPETIPSIPGVSLPSGVTIPGGG